MSRRVRADPRRIKIHISYTVEELARLLGCHKRSVRNWIRQGLGTLDDGKRPVLIQGATARAFLEERRRTSKRRCKAGELYCLRCREPRSPVDGSTKISESDLSSPMLSAVCSQCGAQMFKRITSGAADTLRRQLELEGDAGAGTLKQAA